MMINKPQKPTTLNLRMAYGIFMCCIYIGMAWFFALAPFRTHTLVERGFAGILLVYGIYRVVRLVRHIKQNER